MLLRADRVSVETSHGTLVPATSLTVRTGELTVVHGEPSEGITAFGLTLADRFRPSTGSVSVTDTASGHGARDVTAIVDAPGVTSPDEALPLQVIVGEELAFAGSPARRHDVTRWLARHELTEQAGERFERLPAATRTRLLTTLAAGRPGVRLLVLDRPDRHTSDMTEWHDLAVDYAARGYAVVVLTATTAPDNLPSPPAELGALEQPAPLDCRAERPQPEADSAPEAGQAQPERTEAEQHEQHDGGTTTAQGGMS